LARVSSDRPPRLRPFYLPTFSSKPNERSRRARVRCARRQIGRGAEVEGGKEERKTIPRSAFLENTDEEDDLERDRLT